MKRSKAYSTNMEPLVTARSTMPYEKSLYLAQSKSPDWGKVMKLLQKAIEQADARGHYAIATWYLHGFPPLKIEMNIRKAIPLLRAAVQQGITEAFFDLAVCYETGQGVAKSEARAFELYCSAALRKDTDSLFEVGRMYFHGIGVARNRRLAKIWLDAAEREKALSS